MRKLSLKHEEVYQRIRREMVQGNYCPGEQLPTEAQWARELRASRPTVGRVMRRLQEEGLIVRRQGAGSFVAPHAATAVRKLGILVTFARSTADRGFMGPLLSEIAHDGTAAGFSVGLSSFPGDNEDRVVITHARNACADLIRQGVNAVLFFPLDLPSSDSHAINHEIATALQAAGITLVLMDRDLDSQGRRSPFDCVAINNSQAAAELTEHLIKLGCRRLAMVTLASHPTSVLARMEGFRKVLQQHDLPVGSDSFPAVAYHDRQAVQTLLTRRAHDALVCINDGVAALAMHEALAVGLRVPEDIRIVGFDDDGPICAGLPVPLTTVRQPVQALAAEAIHAVDRRLQRPDLPARDILLSPEVIVRRSCGSNGQA